MVRVQWMHRYFYILFFNCCKVHRTRCTISTTFMFSGIEHVLILVRPSSSSTFRTFSSLTAEILFPLNTNPDSPDLGTHHPIFVSISLIVLGASDKWSPTLSDLLCLASFTEHNVLKVQPRCSIVRFSFLYKTKIPSCSSTSYLSIHPSVDTGVPTSWPLWPLLLCAHVHFYSPVLGWGKLNWLGNSLSNGALLSPPFPHIKTDTHIHTYEINLQKTGL